MKQSLIQKRMILLVVILFLLGCSLVYYKLSLIESLTFYDTDVYLSNANSSGFNLDADKLHFGLVPIDAAEGYRKIEIINPYPEKMNLELFSNGNIASYLSYSYAGEEYKQSLELSLEPNETKTVKIIFTPDQDKMSIGDYYSGRIFILLERPSFIAEVFT